MDVQDRTPEKRRKARWENGFLAALRETGNVRKACESVQIGRQTAYDARYAHKDFAAAWDQAIEDSMDLLEAEAKRRAHDGLIRYKFDKKGEPLKHPHTGEPYYELDYSDTLLIFLLKGGRPAKFKDRLDIGLSNEDIDAAIRKELDRLADAGPGGAAAAPAADAAPSTEDDAT